MFSLVSRPAVQASAAAELQRLRCVRAVTLLLVLQSVSLVDAMASDAAPATEPAPMHAVVAPTPTDDLAAVVRQINRPKPRRFTLRCWQHGRLIIERLVVGIPAGANDVVRLGEAEATGVALFERRGSICMIE